ncbi:hypothetical protein LO80_04580 [Candidatus Francisella endociliophora]|uniref:Photosystem I protein M (PsaM) n=1 Tax=Candidatus Francisella endociliophora TaxID=653937 RepID=A0A097ERT6_9GAMM|nr:hypothetical protein LO80_04580 [Francisella sp. FSC1006]
MNISRQKNYGLSLVELLVAVTLSIIASSIAINIYLNIKDFYKSSTEKADADVKELTVKQAIYDSIIGSGLSCAYGTSSQTYTNNTGDDLSGDSFLTDSSNIRIGNITPNISDYLETNLGAECLGTCYQNDTDYIMVKRQVKSATLSGNLINSTLNLDSSEGIATGDYLTLCNSQQVDLVKVSTINQNDITLTNPATGQYITGDYVGKFEILLFYIGDSGRVDSDGNDIYSLFLYIKSGANAGQAYELVSGVNNLKVSYATVDNNSIIWNNVSNDVDVDTLDTSALKFSFTINSENFSKIVLL